MHTLSELPIEMGFTLTEDDRIKITVDHGGWLLLIRICQSTSKLSLELRLSTERLHECPDIESASLGCKPSLQALL